MLPCLIIAYDCGSECALVSEIEHKITLRLLGAFFFSGCSGFEHSKNIPQTEHNHLFSRCSKNTLAHFTT